MAIPGMLLQIAKASPMMGQIKQMYKAVQMAQNPQMTLNQMISNNPLMKQVMDVVNQYGGVDNALSAMSSQYGITEQDLMELLK